MVSRPVSCLLSGVAGAAVLLAGCGEAQTPDPSPTTTTTTPTATPTTSPAETTGTPTSSGPGFDCATVQAAQKALDDAYAAELDELGIRRGDPRAQSVFTIVTTNEGPTYSAAVLAAAPPEQTPDAQFVLDYYQRLAARAGTLDTGTGSAEDLAAAMTALDDATLVVNPDPATATQVIEAQERLQAAVERDCSNTTATATATGTATQTETGTPAN